MAKWNLDVPAVAGVLNRTVHVAEDFEPHLKTYGKNLGSAAKSSGSGIIAQALVDFAKHHKLGVEGMVKQTVSSVKGAGEATKAYVRGDLEMAANAQHQVAAARKR